jgi:fucose permease
MPLSPDFILLTFSKADRNIGHNYQRRKNKEDLTVFSIMSAASTGRGHELSPMPKEGQVPDIGGMPTIDNEQDNSPHDIPQEVPLGTTMKFLAASFSFFVAGVNDGSIGPIIPSVIREHNISTAAISSM